MFPQWSAIQPLTPSAGPQYQSHVYDNCDECEELLCFSLQLTWHKIFHYKLIATILWFSHSIVTDAQNVFNTGPNYFAINSQFLKLSLISNLIRTLSFSFFTSFLKDTLYTMQWSYVLPIQITLSNICQVT